jgi:hypothetical protein
MAKAFYVCDNLGFRPFISANGKLGKSSFSIKQMRYYTLMISISRI